MDKKFEDWHKLKEIVHKSQQRPRGYKEREVWWICLGHNIGVEEDGKGENFDRPILIVRGFNSELFWGIPLSTTKKRTEYHYPFVLNGEVSVAILSQLRALDTMRLINKIGMMNIKDFELLKDKLKEFLL